MTDQQVTFEVRRYGGVNWWRAWCNCCSWFSGPVPTPEAARVAGEKHAERHDR